jgi:hypothetical protein
VADVSCQYSRDPGGEIPASAFHVGGRIPLPGIVLFGPRENDN